MKVTFMLMMAALGLLATDHSGVRPRGAAKDYPAYDGADGVTIAAAVLPANKVKRQLSPEMVKAGYTVLEIAVYPDAGKEVDVFTGDFTMRVGADPNVANAETPLMVARSIEAERIDEPQIPDRIQVDGEQTIGVSTGGRDPATGRRYPSSVYTETGVGVGIGNPRVGNPPPVDPRYPPGDPRNPDMTGGGAPRATPRTLAEKLAEKALPEGRTTKAVAGYVYFPQVSPTLVNSNAPYHLDYSGPTGHIHLTVPAK
jgi:hypothetical protein